MNYLYENLLHKKKVLVVEPFQEVREMLRMFLRRDMGAGQVLDARDGEEGLLQVAKFAPDVVVSADMMDPMSGIEMTKKIRAGFEDCDPFTPVILMLARAELGQIVSARDAGVNEFLAKPVSVKALELRLMSVINNPRPFVRSELFFGPDRRRRQAEYKGQERREELEITATDGR